MAAIVPTAVKNYYGSVAAVTAAAVLFDASAVNAPLCAWEVHIVNNDATATNLLYIGFDASVDATLGYAVKGAQGEEILYSCPPGTVIYGFASGARDVRVIAIPVLY